MIAFLAFMLAVGGLLLMVLGLIKPRLVLRRRENPTRAQAAAGPSVLFALSTAVFVSAIADHPQPEAAEPLPPGLEDRIISLSNAGLVAALRNESPRLSLVSQEKHGPVVVETYVSEPSKVRLILETLPGHGLLPENPAVVKASMTRPLVDKPSPYDGGLAKTLDSFVAFSAPDWHGAEQKAFVQNCLKHLSDSGCDQTIRGLRVVAIADGSGAFTVQSFRP